MMMMMMRAAVSRPKQMCTNGTDDDVDDPFIRWRRTVVVVVAAASPSSEDDLEAKKTYRPAPTPNADVLVKETALRVEEAKAKSLVQKVKRLKEKKEKKVVEERRASEKERELTENEQRRKANKEKMRMVGGESRRTGHRGRFGCPPSRAPFASVAFYYLTIQTSDGIVEYVKDAFGNLGPTYAKSGLVSLTVGTGVVLSSVFAFSAIILILTARKKRSD